MPISSIDRMAPAPITDSVTWGESQSLSLSAMDPGYLDITLAFEWGRKTLSPELALATSATMARSAGAPDMSILGESEPQRSLALCMLMMFLLGALMKCVRSPVFYDVISDVCFVLSAIERGGQDGRP